MNHEDDPSAGSVDETENPPSAMARLKSLARLGRLSTRIATLALAARFACFLVGRGVTHTM